MQPRTAIIIDDEKMARTLLAGMLAEYCPDIQVLDLCPDLPSGIKAIRKHKPNIVFLDIEMPGYSGLELLDFFDEQEIDFSIIFTTAYNQYALQAFKLSAIDYLLKPIEPAELEQALERHLRHSQKKNYQVLKDNLNNVGCSKLAVHTINSVKFIETDQILFLKAEGAYTELMLANGKTITASKGLKRYEEILKDNPSFFRCHKSYIINLKHLSEHIKSDGGYLRIADHHEVSLSSEKVIELYKLMNWV
ncbi:MAG: response regulator [Chitinophagaceae bacterium]|nr:response regulator [Chitinophagaceae bacterium]